MFVLTMQFYVFFFCLVTVSLYFFLEKKNLSNYYYKPHTENKAPSPPLVFLSCTATTPLYRSGVNTVLF